MNRRQFLHSLESVAVCSAAGGSLLAEQTPPPLDLGHGPQLFLDDYLIEKREGLKREVPRDPVLGFRLPDGRAVSESEPVATDALAARVSWPKPPAALKGQLVRLEFHVRDAALFGFEFQADRG